MIFNWQFDEGRGSSSTTTTIAIATILLSFCCCFFFLLLLLFIFCCWLPDRGIDLIEREQLSDDNGPLMGIALPPRPSQTQNWIDRRMAFVNRIYCRNWIIISSFIARGLYYITVVIAREWGKQRRMKKKWKVMQCEIIRFRNRIWWILRWWWDGISALWLD